ncbi:MAG TPA: long-chain fatty acid--CoA ligase [Kribbellaceae bacterium]|nr:long-chain fatty acid--CoA ligase [Kribbellaceae bacterium]
MTETAPADLRAHTIADLAFVSADRFGDEPALQYRAGDGWEQQTFAELGNDVHDLALGLVANVEPGERVCILGETRPEWTRAGLAVLAAGAVVVPIYATSSREECAWVIEDSGARLVICENAAAAARIASLEVSVRIVTMEPVDGYDSLADLAVVGREADPAELHRRRAAVQADDIAVIIYTSGTTGRAKGCVLTHRNWLRIGELTEEMNIVRRADVVYLFLPLAHVFAQMTQFACVSIGATLVFWGGDVSRIVPELAEVRPTFLPSVPRIFEKVHAAVTASLDPAVVQQAVAVGLQVRALRQRGEPVPAELAAGFEQLEPLFGRVQAVFGGRLRQALSGAAPIAKEVVEFFHAAGVPVLEGYGLTETTGVGTVNTITDFRPGSVGRATPGVELRLADDGEIEMRGPHVFAGYWNNASATAETIADGWIRTGDLGALDADGFVTITGRKKDIIVTAGGKNISPANLENDLRQSPWISHAVVYGDRRPYPVALITLDPDTVPAWAAAQGVEVSSDAVRSLISGVVDAVNDRYSKASQLKRFAILPDDLSVESGELTPSLKIKRRVVSEHHADVIESLYT